jgi:hypothetical protein
MLLNYDLHQKYYPTTICTRSCYSTTICRNQSHFFGVRELDCKEQVRRLLFLNLPRVKDKLQPRIVLRDRDLPELNFNTLLAWLKRLTKAIKGSRQQLVG